MVKRFDDEIKDYTTKKESLNKKKSQLEEEIKANKKRKEELTSESEKLDKGHTDYLFGRRLYGQ